MFYDEEEEDVSFIMLTRSGFYSYYSGEDLELFALRSGGKWHSSHGGEEYVIVMRNITFLSWWWEINVIFTMVKIL